MSFYTLEKCCKQLNFHWLLKIYIYLKARYN
jgi:hypothetical protein